MSNSIYPGITGIDGGLVVGGQTILAVVIEETSDDGNGIVIVVKHENVDYSGFSVGDSVSIMTDSRDVIASGDVLTNDDGITINSGDFSAINYDKANFFVLQKVSISNNYLSATGNVFSNNGEHVLADKVDKSVYDTQIANLQTQLDAKLDSVDEDSILVTYEITGTGTLNSGVVEYTVTPLVGYSIVSFTAEMNGHNYEATVVYNETRTSLTLFVPTQLAASKVKLSMHLRPMAE